MSVKEVEKRGLYQKVEITVATKVVEDLFEDELQRWGSQQKIAGFRPGKIPPPILKAKFGEHALREAISRAISDEGARFFKDKNIEVARQPAYAIVSQPSLQDMAKPLVFSIAFDLKPQVGKVSLDDLTLSQAKISIKDKDVDEVLEAWAQNYKKSVEIKRPSKPGDILVVNVEVTPPGKPGQTMEGMELWVHEQDMGEALFKKCVGVKPGDVVERKTPIPKSEADKTIAGKKVPTKYTVVAVKERTALAGVKDLPEALGVKAMDDVRKKAQDELKAKAEKLSFFWLKRQILDYLAKHNTQDMPESLVTEEYQKLWQTAWLEAGLPVRDMPKTFGQAVPSSASPEEKKAAKAHAEALHKTFDKTEKELDTFFKNVSHRRVCLGFVLSGLGETLGVSLTEEELKGAILAEMQQHPGREQQVLAYYQKNPAAVDALKGPLFEDKIVRALIEKKKPQQEETFSLAGIEKRLEEEESVQPKAS
ncbi:trigger factor [Candidatus Hepatobacter penaei]|uniref:trigger factor n=1 Tax=Candidatus Hepatobacter penaei TaxID=1274402 RepID=UPI0004F28CD0|nr:trigger factor [Candidatus Hepatobacter penaei]